jgi:hypothetical protein
MINSTYNEVNRNLLNLEEEGIIKTKRLGSLKIIGLQKETPKTLALLKALELLDSQSYHNDSELVEKKSYGM